MYYVLRAMNGNMVALLQHLLSRRAAGNDKLILKSIDGAAGEFV
jgi:hypothetical protein